MFLFADDTNALTRGPDLNNLIDFVNCELHKLSIWFKANKMSVNIKKTKYMIFRTKNRPINLNGKDIFMNFNDPNNDEKPELKLSLSRVYNEGDKDNKTIRVLGVLFDEYLSFNDHVLHLQRKLAKALFLLNRSKNFFIKKSPEITIFCHVPLTFILLSYNT
jgi:hypothetical protein